MVFCDVYATYQQLIEYSPSMLCHLLKHIYNAKRLQLPMSLGTMFKTYGMLWACAARLTFGARLCGEETMRILVCASRSVCRFNLCFVLFVYFGFCSLSLGFQAAR